MRTVGVVDLPLGSTGDHLCWTFSDQHEYVTAAVTFLRQGLERNECLLFVGDLATEDQLLSALGDLGDVRSLVASGALSVRRIQDLYRHDCGKPDRVAQVRVYEELTEAAVAHGYAGLRLAADATTLVTDSDARRHFAEYELDVDRVMAKHPMTALCAYDASVLGPAVLELLAVHPCRHGAHDPGFSLYQGLDGLQLAGEVDMSNGDLFAMTLEAAAVTEGCEVQIDLAGLSFIDVHNLVRLDRFAASLAEHGRRLRLVDPDALVRRCSQILGLPSLADALEVSP